MRLKCGYVSPLSGKRITPRSGCGVGVVGGGLDEADSSKGRKGWGVEGVGVGEREGSERARTSSY